MKKSKDDTMTVTMMSSIVNQTLISEWVTQHHLGRLDIHDDKCVHHKRLVMHVTLRCKSTNATDDVHVVAEHVVMKMQCWLLMMSHYQVRAMTQRTLS